MGMLPIAGPTGIGIIITIDRSSGVVNFRRYGSSWMPSEAGSHIASRSAIRVSPSLASSFPLACIATAF
jgi:hypothetical protein